MEIKVGDKALLKKETELSGFEKWLGKVVTVKTILHKDPLVFEFEEDEDIKPGELAFFRLFGNALRFEKEPTKSNWVRIIDIEKVIEPKVEVKRNFTKEELEKIEKKWSEDMLIKTTGEKVYVVMAKGIIDDRIHFHLVGVYSTEEKAKEAEKDFNATSEHLKATIQKVIVQ